MKYTTKHKKDLLLFLSNNYDKHFTIEELKLESSKKNIIIGQTTLYRLLDELITEGKVKKYFIDNKRSACYQYISNNEECNHHFHLICNKCQKLLHLDCDEVNTFIDHINEEHNFFVDTSKIVFYGLCQDCQRRNIDEENN